MSVDSSAALSRCSDIIINEPLPDQWVLVKQLNMETREPCEIWRSGVHNQIKKMRCQLNVVCKELQKLDEDINRKLQSTTVTTDEDEYDDKNEQTDDNKRND